MAKSKTAHMADKPTRKHEIKGASPKTRKVLGQKDRLLTALKRLFRLGR